MPELETSRLRLRPFQLTDLPDYHRQLASDAEVMQTLLPGKALSLEEARLFFNSFIEHWERHKFGLWLIFDKQAGNLIGQCGLRFLKNTPEYELAYAIARSHWGLGIATEAAKASVRYGFEQLQAYQIIALAAPTNFASQRVMQKLGLKYQKKGLFYNKPFLYYALLRESWQADDGLYILQK